MRRLADVLEHLDGDLRDQATLDGNLRDLGRINRAFGGAQLSIESVRQLVESIPADGRPGKLRVLDVGAGGCDIPLAMVGAPGPWRDIHVTAVDRRQEILDAARRLHPTLDSDARIEVAVADGRSLPWSDGAFDVAHTSLVLHHLSRDEALAFLAELRRIACVGVVVNDLARSRVHWLGAWLVLHTLTRNPWTLHDGVLSVRRAWTLAEASALLREAGLRPVHTIVGLAGHRWAIGAMPA